METETFKGIRTRFICRRKINSLRFYNLVVLLFSYGNDVFVNQGYLKSIAHCEWLKTKWADLQIIAPYFWANLWNWVAHSEPTTRNIWHFLVSWEFCCLISWIEFNKFEVITSNNRKIGVGVIALVNEF